MVMVMMVVVVVVLLLLLLLLLLLIPPTTITAGSDMNSSDCTTKLTARGRGGGDAECKGGGGLGGTC